MHKRYISLFTLIILIITLLCGCVPSGSASPETVAIEVDGETVTTLEVVNGSEVPVLTAKISPEAYSGEYQWESSDGGVVRVSGTEGNTCTIKVLKSGTAKITLRCGDKEATLKVTVQKNQSQLSERETAYYINDTRYSAELLNLYYVDAYNSFLTDYGDYAYYYGLDSESGISSLSDQSCDYSSDGTWKGYFLETACSNLLYGQALCDWADENGYALGEEETAEISEQIQALSDKATENGYADADEYLEALYGSGVSCDMYEQYITDLALADVAYSAFCDSLSYTDAELKEHYKELGYDGENNEYSTVSMRHILILAEEAEDGSVSDEAIQAAHERAEEIYNEWQSGEATEESFTALASEYSDDTASVSTGGLYENIAKGEMVDEINSWLFAKSRKEGDTAVLDNNGSYVGSHVVYFCGKGEKYSLYLARQDLMDSDISLWMESLLENYSVITGSDYASVGNF